MPLVRLTEICQSNTVTSKQDYTLREVFVNPEHVIMIREEARLKQLNEQSRLMPDLESSHRFTKLTINRGRGCTRCYRIHTQSTKKIIKRIKLK